VISIHTTRKVVTATCRDCGIVTPDFNPHHPQGGDEWKEDIRNRLQISIHTTRKVVTNDILVGRYMSKISIHTTRKVVTLLEERLKWPDIFQSTPPARW